MAVEVVGQFGEHAQRLVDLQAEFYGRYNEKILPRLEAYFLALMLHDKQTKTKADRLRKLKSAARSEQGRIPSNIPRRGRLIMDLQRLLELTNFDLEGTKRDFRRQFEIIFLENSKDPVRDVYWVGLEDVFSCFDINLRTDNERKREFIESGQLRASAFLFLRKALNEDPARFSTEDYVRLFYLLQVGVNERSDLVHEDAIETCRETLEWLESILSDEAQAVLTERAKVTSILASHEEPQESIDYDQRLLEVARGKGYQVTAESSEADFEAFGVVLAHIFEALGKPLTETKNAKKYFRDKKMTRAAIDALDEWLDSESFNGDALSEINTLLNFAARHQEDCLTRNIRAKLLENGRPSLDTPFGKLIDKLMFYLITEEEIEVSEEGGHGEYLVARYSEIIKGHARDYVEEYSNFFTWFDERLVENTSRNIATLIRLSDEGMRECRIYDDDFREEFKLFIRDTIRLDKKLYPELAKRFVDFYEVSNIHDPPFTSACSVLGRYLRAYPRKGGFQKTLDGQDFEALAQIVATLDAADPDNLQAIEDLYHIFGFYLDENKTPIETDLEPSARATLARLEQLFEQKSPESVDVEKCTQDFFKFKVADLKRKNASYMREFAPTFDWLEETKISGEMTRKKEIALHRQMAGKMMVGDRITKGEADRHALVARDIQDVLKGHGWVFKRIRIHFLRFIDEEIERQDDPHTYVFGTAVEDVFSPFGYHLAVRESLKDSYFKDGKVNLKMLQFILDKMRHRAFKVENAVHMLRFAVYVRPQELIQDDAYAKAVEVLTELEGLIPPQREENQGDHAQWLMDRYTAGTRQTAERHLKEHKSFFDWLSRQEDTGHPERNKYMILQGLRDFSIPESGNLAPYLISWVRVRGEEGEIIDFARVCEELPKHYIAWREAFEDPDIVAASGIVNRYLKPGAHGDAMRLETLNHFNLEGIKQLYARQDLDFRILEELYHALAFYLYENKSYPIDPTLEPEVRVVMADLESLYEQRRPCETEGEIDYKKRQEIQSTLRSIMTYILAQIALRERKRAEGMVLAGTYRHPEDPSPMRIILEGVASSLDQTGIGSDMAKLARDLEAAYGAVSKKPERYLPAFFATLMPSHTMTGSRREDIERIDDDIDRVARQFKIGVPQQDTFHFLRLKIRNFRRLRPLMRYYEKFDVVHLDERNARMKCKIDLGKINRTQKNLVFEGGHIAVAHLHANLMEGHAKGYTDPFLRYLSYEDEVSYSAEETIELMNDMMFQRDYWQEGEFKDSDGFEAYAPQWKMADVNLSSSDLKDLCKINGMTLVHFKLCSPAGEQKSVILICSEDASTKLKWACLALPPLALGRFTLRAYP